MTTHQRKRIASRCANHAPCMIAVLVTTMVLLIVSPARAYQVVQVQPQAESRDAAGRITVEAANIHVVACNAAGENGGQFYIYQYTRRPGFRAIQPPAWGQPLGGRDHSTFAEAVTVACRAGLPGAPPGPTGPGDLSPSDLGTI